MAKYTENLAHAHAVDTRPSLCIIEGLGTRLIRSMIIVVFIDTRTILVTELNLCSGRY